MKKSPHNKRFLEVLLKLKYNLEDSFECYNSLGQDLKAEGEIDAAIGTLFVLIKEQTSQAFLRQVSLIKNMDKIVKQQITLVEAENATPYGWNIAKHLEPEHSIFSEQDKANTKALREAEASVRRVNREFNTRKKDIKKKGGTGFNKGAYHPRRTPTKHAKNNLWTATCPKK